MHFQVSPFSRNYSMVLSEGSTSHEYDFEDDDDDEEDDITDGTLPNFVLLISINN